MEMVVVVVHCFHQKLGAGLFTCMNLVEITTPEIRELPV